MSLIEHLEELRKRIFWSILGIAVAFFPCWNYSKWVFDHFLSAPILPYLPNHQLVYNKLSDPFILYFKLACIMAIFASSPFILYQAWRFIAPASTTGRSASPSPSSSAPRSSSWAAAPSATTSPSRAPRRSSSTSARA